MHVLKWEINRKGDQETKQPRDRGQYCVILLLIIYAKVYMIKWYVIACPICNTMKYVSDITRNGIDNLPA